ncbi:hypothetical protein D3C77_504730 [compost metagenome]
MPKTAELIGRDQSRHVLQIIFCYNKHWRWPRVADHPLIFLMKLDDFVCPLLNIFLRFGRFDLIPVLQDFRDVAFRLNALFTLR